MILSELQIAALAHDVGVPDATLPTAVAIAIAESGGSTTAIGDVALETATWGPSVGLWQIRTLKAQRGTGGPRDETRLSDPAFNAAAMFVISGHGSNFSPWSTYTSGAYRAHLPGAEAAAQQLLGRIGSSSSTAAPASFSVPGVPFPLPDVPGVGNPLSLDGLRTLGDFFARLTQRNTWLRVLEVVIGILAMAWGANVLSRGAVGNYVHQAATAGASVAATAAMA